MVEVRTCISCNGINTFVIDTKDTPIGICRRRKCRDCYYIFYSIENVIDTNILREQLHKYNLNLGFKKR